MGGSTFSNAGKNGETNAQKAFDELVREAQYMSGHGGYTGTIAEKREFTVVQPSPVTFEAAQALEERLIEEGDPRVDDKWGPAGAIRVIDPGDGGRRKPYDGWYFFGWASS